MKVADFCFKVSMKQEDQEVTKGAIDAFSIALAFLSITELSTLTKVDRERMILELHVVAHETNGRPMSRKEICNVFIDKLAVEKLSIKR